MLLVLFASLLGAQAKPEVVIAAAANLTQAMQAIGPAFEAETGIHPVFSFASTSQLAQQIEYGAPFDVFLSADAEHVEQLDRKGLLASATRAVYAQGIVALWIPGGAKVPVSRLEDLTDPRIRVIAIAKPELAPENIIDSCIKNAMISAKKGGALIAGCNRGASRATREFFRWNG